MPRAEQIKPQGTEQGSLFATQSLNGTEAFTTTNYQKSFGQTRLIQSLASAARESNSLSRSSDPITSKLAGEKTKEFRARHIAKIWNCLKENGSKTYKEIASLTGLEPVAVARRRKEMEENHLIEVLEETRNGCALWKAK
jgi:hypothetical protein